MTDAWEFCLSWRIPYHEFIDLSDEEVEALNRAAARIAGRQRRR